MSKNNVFKYTDLTYEDCITKTNEYLAELAKADPKYAQLGSASLFKTLLEVFAANQDNLNYMLERRVQELDPKTAKLDSSIYSIANLYNYPIRRPTPSSAYIKLQIKEANRLDKISTGSLLKYNLGDKIFIPRFTELNANGFKFITKKAYQYTITSDDIQALNIDGSFYILKAKTQDNSGAFTVDEPITIIQGELKTINLSTTEFYGSNQVNKVFQTYVIDDIKFSNIFGQLDVGYNYNTFGTTFTANITRVYKTVNGSITKEYYISKKNFINEYILNTGDPTYNKSAVCLLTTNNDKSITVKFADDIIADLGVTSKDETLWCQYLSTDGVVANADAVIDTMITVSNMSSIRKLSTSNTEEGVTSEFLAFKFYSAITGGLDFESIESIKINAPSSLYTQGRLVTKSDYENFLRSQMIDNKFIRNAIAWGEQDEIFKTNINNPLNQIVAIRRFNNIVLFTLCQSAYLINDQTKTGQRNNDLKDYILTKPFTTTLDPRDYNIIRDNEHFYQVYINNIQNISSLINVPIAQTELYNLLRKLEKVSLVTLKHLYIEPVIVPMKLTGTVYLQFGTSI